jgi:hypothetical protein
VCDPLSGPAGRLPSTFSPGARANARVFLTTHTSSVDTTWPPHDPLTLHLNMTTCMCMLRSLCFPLNLSHLHFMYSCSLIQQQQHEYISSDYACDNSFAAYAPDRMVLQTLRSRRCLCPAPSHSCVCLCPEPSRSGACALNLFTAALPPHTRCPGARARPIRPHQSYPPRPARARHRARAAA